MIELPEDPAPAEAVPTLVDFGMVIQPAGGAGATRIDRAGSRWRWDFTMPPMKPDTARKFEARLTRAKREGLRMPVPLFVDQGQPGSPTVDGAGQSGTALDVENLTPHYVAKEGYWLSIIDGDGTRYLHKVVENVAANGSGAATLEIEPPLRVPFADGATILLGKPEVEGIVVSDVSWPLTPVRLVSMSFTLEESA